MFLKVFSLFNKQIHADLIWSFIREDFEAQPKCSVVVVFFLDCEIIAVFVNLLVPTMRKTT